MSNSLNVRKIEFINAGPKAPDNFLQNQPPIVMQPMGYPGNSRDHPIWIGQQNNVPHGLEHLANLEYLFVTQKVELLEVLLGCETENKYQIFNYSGQEIFSAKENTDCLTRNCLGRKRPFEMSIVDQRGEEVIHLSRPLACGICCLRCCPQSIEIHAPLGNLIGTVEEEWNLLIPKYQVKDETGSVVLRIEGPCCKLTCCGDVEFYVLSANDNSEICRISKKWSGFAREFFTDADNFRIKFPSDLDVKLKAVILGASMLIDFMYFENNK
ncbi:Phospholipid scramblase 2 [Pseudolycoriella hygida]|uniref:Phospholipid scramblase n=1 Tax=Pseudolycoriella hygida TaxID=35572 RepID=A0A9Q0RV16_9DIPT|nr:Phospholipid scramblase 2 [Pseudolycoriella hygida]